MGVPEAAGLQMLAGDKVRGRRDRRGGQAEGLQQPCGLLGGERPGPLGQHRVDRRCLCLSLDQSQVAPRREGRDRAAEGEPCSIVRYRQAEPGVIAGSGIDAVRRGVGIGVA